jgi:hypothetical protein
MRGAGYAEGELAKRGRQDASDGAAGAGAAGAAAGRECEKRDAGRLRANLTKKARAAISCSAPPLLGALPAHWPPVGSPNPIPPHHHGPRASAFPSAIREASGAPPIRLRPSSLLPINHVLRCWSRGQSLHRATSQDRGTCLLITKPGRNARTLLTHPTQLHAHLTGSISRQCLHDVWADKRAADHALHLEDPLIAIPPGKVDYDIKT